MSPAGQDDADLVVEEIDIHRAVGRNDEELINKFVLGGGNLEARDKDWLTPLHVAAAGGLLAAVEFFMKHKGRAKLVDSKSKIGHTPLHLACRFGHLPVVLLLLAEDADINAKDNDDNTPLHKAASNGKAQLCRELVKRGADVDARNSTEYTPLHWACLKGHKGAVEQLLKCGANINATSSRRATGLFLSSYYGYADVTFLLIAWGADTAITNEDDLKPGDAFLPEVSLAQRKQTRVLLAEKLALLMKGYEATRRNMALMYMRSERSELNLRMTQGEVETLWTQLGKREKELNRSKIGARDLSHAVKSMKAALETTREESKAAWDTVEALQVELKSAQLEAQEQSERALRAERSLAELRRRTGDTPSSGEEAEGRNASDERSAVPPDSSSTETPTAAAAAAVSTATESELQKRRIRETAEESALRRYSLASFEGRSFESSNNTSVCSSSAPSPETSASLPPSQQLSLSLPAGRIAELASAINSRVARLGHGAVEPLPPPPPPPPLTSTNNKADRFRRCSASAAVGGGGSPASLPPLRGRGGSRYGGAKRRASGAGGVGDRATPTSTTTTVASSSYCRCFSSAPSLSLSSACCSSSSSSCSCVPNVSRWRSAAASSTGPSDSVAVPAIDSSAHAAATAGDATRTPAVDKNSSTSSSAGAASDWTSALSAGFPCMRAGDCSPSPEVAEARRRTASRAATVARLIGIATEKEERQGGGPLSVAVQKHGDDEGDRQWHKSNHSDETLPASPETASARRSSAHADAGEEVAATGRRDASCSSDSPRAVAEVASAEPSAAERTLGTEGVSVEGEGEGEGEEDAKFSSKRTQ